MPGSGHCLFEETRHLKNGHWFCRSPQEYLFYEIGFQSLWERDQYEKDSIKIESRQLVFINLLLTLKHLDIAFSLPNPQKSHLGQTLQRQALTISPCGNSADAIHHSTEQIPTPAPLKTDLQFSVKLRCFAFLPYSTSPISDERWLQGPSDALADRKTIKAPESPKSKRLHFIHYPNLSNSYQKRLRRHE